MPAETDNSAHGSASNSTGSFRRQERSIKTSFRTQAYAIFRKNLSYQRRSLGANLFIIITPIFFCILLYVLQLLVNGAFDTPENKCGCLCLTCCVDDGNDGEICRDSSLDNPCQTWETCKTYDTNVCGYQYSDAEQAGYCAIPSPSIWPAMLQVPAPGSLAQAYAPAAAFLYTGNDEATATSITSQMFADPVATPEKQAAAAEFLALGQQTGALYAASVSFLGVTLGSFQKTPFWNYYIEPGFVRTDDYNASLSAVFADINAPSVNATIQEISNAFGALSGESGTRQGPTVSPLQGLPVWIDTADDINNILYCGYEDSRCNGSYNAINEYAQAWDFQDTSLTNGIYQMRMWYNLSGAYGESGDSGSPPQFVRVNQGINTATNAFLKAALGSDYQALLVGMMDMPKGSSELRLDFSSLLGPLFYTWLLQLLLPMMLVGLVQERAGRLRSMMKMHGLGDAPYWTIQYTWYFVTNLIYAWVLIGAGSAIQLSFFTRTSYSFQFVFYLLWVSCLVAFTFLLSTLFSSSRTATVVSFLYVFGTGLIGFILLGRFISAGYWWIVFLELVPGLALFSGLWEISQYAFRAAYQDSEGITWSNISDDGNRIPGVMIIFAVESVVFMVLAWYLEQVLPGGSGVPRHPLFFLGYKYGDDPTATRTTNTITTKESSVKVEMEAPDVKEERLRIETMSPELLANEAIVIKDLKKVFRAVGGGKEKVAVRGLTMAVNRGECFGLLGPNGAGKSTSLNILTGFLTPSGGTAFVNGNDIARDMDNVYGVMGVCPQDNLLWERLSARDHLMFYGRLKNLSGAALEEAVNESLRNVNLLSGGVGDRPVKTYSGGMKRRLSVAISLIGEPLVVYLDEPSTGLDPASRQNLWSVVQEAKQNRGIILTTHSMEEASVLCDRLGIFVDGQLVCIGNPKELTARYGRYLVFSITTAQDQTSSTKVDDLVKSMSPNAHLIYSLAGTFKYEIPTEDVSLSAVFERMEVAEKDMAILDWGVANATLEEVFIRFAKSIGAEGGV